VVRLAVWRRERLLLPLLLVINKVSSKSSWWPVAYSCQMPDRKKGDPASCWAAYVAIFVYFSVVPWCNAVRAHHADGVVWVERIQNWEGMCGEMR
jgi:hypothetical protein